jgi:hypothetical protein
MSSQLPHALPRPPSPVAPPPPKPKEVGLLVVVVLKAQHLEDKHKFSKVRLFVPTSNRLEQGS